MTVLPQVREQLDTAAQRLVDMPESAPGRRARRTHGKFWRMKTALSRVALLASAVVLAAVVAIVILVGRPTGGSQPIPAARSPESQGAALTRILGVLRRPQSSADRDPQVLRLLRRDAPLGKAQGAPDLSLLRKATVTPWHSTVFLYPVTPLTEAQIATLPAQLRATARINAARTQHDGDGLDVLEIDKSGGASGSGDLTAKQILATGIDHYTVGRMTTRVITVVPDGVTKVVILRPRQHGPLVHVYAHVLKISVAVHNNIAAFQLPTDRVNQNQSPTQYMKWFGRHGLIRRFGPRHASKESLRQTAPRSVHKAKSCSGLRYRC